MATEISRSAALWRSLRPHQWVKNVLLFGGLAFTGRWHRATSGAGLAEFFDWSAIGAATLAFLIFCALSSAGYLVNDIRDREADAKHPLKRHRPIASGRLAVSTATALAAGLFAGGLLLAWWLARRPGTAGFFHVALGYALVTNWYSFQLKSYVIIDVLTIAGLFVLRAIAGCFVVPEEPSPWIIVCTLFGALFIALCKRRGELVAQEPGESGETRPVLQKYETIHGYPAGLLDQMIQIAATATIVSYAQYTFARPIELHMEGERLGLMSTIPFVVYGVFRYLYLVHKKDIGQKPERLFLDRGMLVNLAVWGLVVVWVTRGRTGG